VCNALLTAAQPAVAGELQGPLGAVPAVPGKLELALLDAALRPGCHAAGVDEVGLGESSGSAVGTVRALLQPPSTRCELAKPSQDELASEEGQPRGNGLGMSPGCSQGPGSCSAALVPITGTVKLV